MENQEIDMNAFRKLTKEKRQKGRPKLTLEEKERRLREKSLRLTHINRFAEPNGLRLIKTRTDGRDCFKWEAIEKTMQKKIEALNETELVVFTTRLNMFTYDQWQQDMLNILDELK